MRIEDARSLLLHRDDCVWLVCATSALWFYHSGILRGMELTAATAALSKHRPTDYAAFSITVPTRCYTRDAVQTFDPLGAQETWL